MPSEITVKQSTMSCRRSSSICSPLKKTKFQLPWDLVDRLLLPIFICHAAATISCGILKVLHISDVPTVALFLWFSASTIIATLFYHNLKVSPPGKAVVVTGCESPIACNLAKKLDNLGFSVFAGFTKSSTCKEAAILKEEGSGRMKILQLDVTAETQLLEASLCISEHLSDGSTSLWGIIHCATCVALGELEWIPFSVIRKSIDVNLLGAARLTQIMLPLLRQGNGRIVFLSSALAHIPTAVRSIECATHAAIEGLASCLKQELRHRNIEVSVVATREFSAGTAWFFGEKLEEQAKNMWSSLSEVQRNVYGEEYFESAIRSLEKYSKMENDVTLTVQSLVDAVMRTFPLDRYTPVTKYEKVQTLIARYLPRSFYELIYK